VNATAAVHRNLVGFDGGVQVDGTDNLCHRCQHQTGPFRCRQTDLGLSPGWPRGGGVYTSSVEGVRRGCPRFAVAPRVPLEYAGPTLELLRAEHGAS